MSSFKHIAMLLCASALVLGGAPEAMGNADAALRGQADNGPQSAKTCDLEVTVTGSGGKPIERAKVECTHAGGTVSGTTDDRGLCAFKALPQGSARLSVSAEGWAPASESVSLSDGTTKASISLKPLVTTLQIDVVGKSDAGTVGRCDVTVQWASGEERNFTTDGDGRALLPDLPRGMVKITASAVGWKLRVVRDYRLEKDQQELRLELERLTVPN